MQKSANKLINYYYLIIIINLPQKDQRSDFTPTTLVQNKPCPETVLLGKSLLTSDFYRRVSLPPSRA